MSSAAGAHISQIMAFRRIARQRRPPGTPSFVLQRFLSPALQLELLHHSAVESDAATDRRTVMRPSTIPILAAVAFSLAVPSNADARPRFGPAVLLGVVAGSFGAMFGGFRHSSRHHRRSATHPSVGQRSARAARMERRAALSAPTLSSCPLPPTARPRRMSGARSGSPQCTRRDPLCRRRSRHTRDRDLQSRQRASSPHSRHGLTHRLQHRNQTRRISLQQEPVSRLRSRRRPPCEPCPQGGLSPPTGYLYTVRL